MTLLLLFAGLLLLLGGGEALVRGSVAVARRLGISPLLVGLTLVGFGTSMPELVASLEAALAGSPGIAVGNVVGSNIANVLLILGLAAIIRPVGVGHGGFRRDAVILVTVSAVLVGLARAGTVSRTTGAGLLCLLLAYTLFAYWSERRAFRESARTHESSAEDVTPAAMGIALGLTVTVSGIGAVILGANWLVGAAIDIAQRAHISEAVIGVTLVAVGTSLPELITSVMAAVRGHSDVAYGNIVGSNIFNVLGILGVTATVQEVTVPPELVVFDLWVMLGSALLLIVFGSTARRIGRREGAVLLAGYTLYMLLLLVPALRAWLPLH